MLQVPWLNIQSFDFQSIEWLVSELMLNLQT